MNIVRKSALVLALGLVLVLAAMQSVGASEYTITGPPPRRLATYATGEIISEPLALTSGVS